ncbi:hypothetical protein PV10_07332 [Exophiala mesophila]|uniref:RING-type domain-containing protein n=1 Tax=Exophiala mesophila TaxID=212818 RepID=A0A0D1WLV9_EXOME|nr:uncharacterized protein PV10_07332 [Exophiala mesophila]KIV89980.1 hypothetical protein PV10_07332 [Exophiala mesophila]
MYIPLREHHTDQVLVSIPQLDPSKLPDLRPNYPNYQFVSASLLGSRSDENTTATRQEQNSFDLPEAFVGVSVATIVLMIVIIALAMYRRCSSSPDETNSDSASATTDSAWRIEDIEGLGSSSDGVVAAKHRKRLKKLDQIAPIQSLHSWRTEKQQSHTENFATLTAICLELIEEKEQIRELQCGHVYHSVCLNLWVERGHHDCPLCKYDILGLRPQGSTHQDHQDHQDVQDDENTEEREAAAASALPHQPVPAHIVERIVVINNPQPPPPAT